MRVFIESIQQVKREFARVYRDCKAKKLPDDKAKTLTYILRAIIDANFKYEIQQRIEELERKAGL